MGPEPVAQDQQTAHRCLELLHVCDPSAPFARNSNARGHLLLVDIQRSGALHDHIHSDLPLDDDTIAARQGPRRQTSLRSVLKGNSPGFRARPPHQTNHGLTGTIGNGA